MLFDKHYFVSFFIGIEQLVFSRILALRKAEKEEEKRAREKIRQKLEEDKVTAPLPPPKILSNVFNIFSFIFINGHLIFHLKKEEILKLIFLLSGQRPSSSLSCK